MLKQAVSAGLPLVAIQTRDTVNVMAVITKVLGQQAVPFIPATSPKSLQKGLAYVMIFRPVQKPVDLGDLSDLYKGCAKAETTLILVNPPTMDGALFDAGELETPKEMKRAFLKSAGVNAMLLPALVRTLGNATLKETAELLKLTMVRDGSVTLKGLTRSRRDFFQGQAGLTQVLAEDAFYDPPEELAAWVARERRFFIGANVDPRLVPRGLLFDGPPGTGKTAGAKWISEQLGVPLYRFDVGTTQAKYVGQSEGNTAAVLARLDREEPCVVLIDEIEKVFSVEGDDSSGVNARMMASLLWWLAEHRSRVLTIMTTNAAHKIPPELHRERRIDRTMQLLGVPKGERVARFIERALVTFKIEAPADAAGKAHYTTAVEEIRTAVEAATPGVAVPQSKIAEAVIGAIKDMQVTLDDDD